MKNLKWFLGLALALTFLAWSAPKVLAADDLKTNLETAIKQLQSALNLLVANDVVAPTNGDFGYYAPSWERGQVLGDTDTCAPSPSGCGPDSWFDQASCSCKSNNPPAAGGSTPPPNSGSGTPGVCYQGEAQVPCPTQNQPMVQNSQGGCPFFSYCDGKVIRKDFNGVMCDVCEPNTQPNQQYQGYQPQQGPGQPGQQMKGPDNQDWEKQEAEQQKKMEQQQAQQLKRIKSDATRTLSDAKRMKTQVAKFTKAGLNTAELNTLIGEIEVYANKMKNSASMTDLEDLADTDLGDKFSQVSEVMGLMSRQLELKQRVLPQLAKSVKPFQTAYNRLVKNKNIDQSVLADFKTGLGEVNAFIAQVQTAATAATSADELDNVFSMMDDLSDKFNDLGLKQQAAEFFANYKKGLANFNSLIKNFTNAINKIAKKGEDVADLKEQLAQIQQLYNEIKTAANTKSVDIEGLMEKIGELSDSANTLGSDLNDSGVGVNNVAMPQTQQQPQMQFNMPSSFNFGGQQPQQPQQPQQQMAPGTF